MAAVMQSAARLLILCALLSAGYAPAALAYEAQIPPKQDWSFGGLFGAYDKAQLQRGLKVFEESCNACHSLDYVPLRDLQALGYSMAQIKEFAAQFRYAGLDARGEAAARPGTPQDSFPAPYANALAAAAAHNGAAPPDLSLMARARAARGQLSFISDLFTAYDTAGADYIYALLTGYSDPPQNIIVPQGTYYNRYFSAAPSLAMPPPLHDGQIEYNDGTVQTEAQYAADVTAFLSWAADPHREERKKTGLAAMLLLLVMAALLYGLKREIWAEPPQHKRQSDKEGD